MSEIPQDELSQIYQFAIQLGKGAGKLLLDALDARRDSADTVTETEYEEKLNAVDIVTQTDNGMSLYALLQSFEGGSTVVVRS